MSQTPSEKLLIGAHTSAAGGVHNALLEGRNIGATTIQLFTSNQKQWSGKEISPETLQLWNQALRETGLQKIMSHASYLINLGSFNEVLLEKSRQTFHQEIERCHQLGVEYLNFHPGTATSGSVEECLDQIVNSLNTYEKLCSKGPTRLLLEATAGQGNSVGHKFEHLAYILERTHKKIPIGVCIDTCHIFVAGYDISTPQGWDETLKKFDQIIGLPHLFAFHVNDSMKPRGSRRDRHAHLGEGEIGIESFRYLMTNPKLREIPKYLETPKGLEEWTKEIALLRKFAS